MHPTATKLLGITLGLALAAALILILARVGNEQVADQQLRAQANRNVQLCALRADLAHPYAFTTVINLLSCYKGSKASDWAKNDLRVLLTDACHVYALSGPGARLDLDGTGVRDVTPEDRQIARSLAREMDDAGIPCPPIPIEGLLLPGVSPALQFYGLSAICGGLLVVAGWAGKRLLHDFRK